MAKINLSICDYCKSITKDGLPFRLALSAKAKKGGAASVKSEICKVCFDEISSRIESEFDFEHINKPIASKSQKRNIKVIDEDVSMVPSNADYSSANNLLNKKCNHDKVSFDPPNMKCKDCGDSWEA